MITPAAAPWLLGTLIIVAMVPQMSSCVELLREWHSPVAFIHLRHSNAIPGVTDLTDPMRHGNGNTLNLSSKTTTTSSATSTTVQLAASSSPTPPSSQRTAHSPWSPGRWKVTLDFGNDESDASERKVLLGKGWGSNSGRLALSLEIVANAETQTVREDDRSTQRAWLGGKPTGSIEPQTGVEGHCASYVNEKGQQYVDISSGQWRIEPPLPLLPSYASVLPGQASTLRFSLTMLSPLERNTIQFPPDQILLLQSNTYRTQQYLSGVQTLSPYQSARDRSQEQLEEQLNHEHGDRRLDGNDILETLEGYKDVAELVKERDKQRRKWKEIEGVLPHLDSSIDTGHIVNANKLLAHEKRWGTWPGDTELLAMERGVILAVVAEPNKRKTGLFSWMQDSGGLKESVVVGKWSALPLFDDGIS